MSKIFKKYVCFVILILPIIGMNGLYSQYPWDKEIYEELIHISGELSIRLLILSLVITPFLSMFPKSKFWKWMRRHRKDFGLASFFYLVIHFGVYLIHLSNASKIREQFYQSTYFAGWIAFTIMIILALTSHTYFVRKLGFTNWKNIQRSVYIVTFLSAMHWLLKEKFEPTPVLAHFVPLIFLEFVRVKKYFAIKAEKT